MSFIDRPKLPALKFKSIWLEHIFNGGKDYEIRSYLMKAKSGNRIVMAQGGYLHGMCTVEVLDDDQRTTPGPIIANEGNVDRHHVKI